MRFFFYGTLMDVDVRRLVLGRHAPAQVEPARLAGWQRFPVAGTSYPAIRRDPPAAVDGVLVRGLDAGAHALLERYEGDGYATLLVEVETATGRRVAAHVFAPRPKRIRRGRGAWDFADWLRRHKRRFIATLARRGIPS